MVRRTNTSRDQETKFTRTDSFLCLICIIPCVKKLAHGLPVMDIKGGLSSEQVHGAHSFLVCNRVTRRPCWGQYNRISLEEK